MTGHLWWLLLVPIATFGLVLPHWQTGVTRMLREIL